MNLYTLLYTVDGDANARHFLTRKEALSLVEEIQQTEGAGTIELHYTSLSTRPADLVRALNMSAACAAPLDSTMENAWFPVLGESWR
jgi:hypothetical protein